MTERWTTAKLAEAKRPLLVLAILCLLGVGIGVFVHRREAAEERAETERRQALAVAWANLWQCTIGGPVPDDQVPAQARRVELAEPPASWPGGCSEHATALFELVKDPRHDSALAGALRERFGCEVSCTVDEPAKQLAQLPPPDALAVVTATVAAPRMIESRFIGKQELPSFGGGEARVLARDVAPDGSARVLLASRSRGNQLCHLRPSEGVVACTPLRLPATEGTLRLVVGGDEPVLVGRARAGDPLKSYDVEANEIETHRGRRDGFVLTALEGRSYELALVRDGAPEHRKKLKLDEGAPPPVIAGEHVVWTEGQTEGEASLMARALIDDEAVVAERSVVGRVAAAATAPRVCASGDTSVILTGDRGAAQSMVFFHDGRWHAPHDVAPARAGASDHDPPGLAQAPSKPEAASSKSARQAAALDVAEFGMIGLLGSGAGAATPTPIWGGAGLDGKPSPIFGRDTDRDEGPHADESAIRAASPRPHLPDQAFTCEADHATLTWRDAIGERIHRVRCTPAACHREETKLDLSPQSWWHASALGDDTLVVWRAAHGELRMRLAPIDQLAAAPDVIVMDAAEHGGPRTLDLEAFTSERGVIFWFRGLGFHGLAIDAQGDYRPVEG